MSDYMITNGELYHYGVKGMKWGVRKTHSKEQKIRKLANKYEKKRDAYANELTKWNRRANAYEKKSYLNDKEFMKANKSNPLKVTSKLLAYTKSSRKLKAAELEYKKQTGESCLEKILSEKGQHSVKGYLHGVNENKIGAQVSREMRGRNTRKH
jgi:hypothetical protein